MSQHLKEKLLQIGQIIVICCTGYENSKKFKKNNFLNFLRGLNGGSNFFNFFEFVDLWREQVFPSPRAAKKTGIRLIQNSSLNIDGKYHTSHINFI